MNDICDLIDTVQVCKDLLLMSHIPFMALEKRKTRWLFLVYAFYLTFSMHFGLADCSHALNRLFHTKVKKYTCISAFSFVFTIPHYQGTLQNQHVAQSWVSNTFITQTTKVLKRVHTHVYVQVGMCCGQRQTISQVVMMQRSNTNGFMHIIYTAKLGKHSDISEYSQFFHNTKLNVTYMFIIYI